MNSNEKAAKQEEPPMGMDSEETSLKNGADEICYGYAAVDKEGNIIRGGLAS